MPTGADSLRYRRERAVSLRPWAYWSILLLALPYLVLNTAFPSASVVYAGGLLVATVAVLAAFYGGLGPSEVLLRWAKPSALTLGLLVAAGMAAASGAAIAGRLELSPDTGTVAGAVASAAGQELYFRGALLAALRHGWRLSPGRAAAAQAVVFSAWHVRAFAEASPAAAIAVLAVALAAGWLWAALALRDRTLIWVGAAHAVFLVVQ